MLEHRPGESLLRQPLAQSMRRSVGDVDETHSSSLLRKVLDETGADAASPTADENGARAKAGVDGRIVHQLRSGSFEAVHAACRPVEEIHALCLVEAFGQGAVDGEDLGILLVQTVDRKVGTEHDPVCTEQP